MNNNIYYYYYHYELLPSNIVDPKNFKIYFHVIFVKNGIQRTKVANNLFFVSKL